MAIGKLLMIIILAWPIHCSNVVCEDSILISGSGEKTLDKCTLDTLTIDELEPPCSITVVDSTVNSELSIQGDIFEGCSVTIQSTKISGTTLIEAKLSSARIAFDNCDFVEITLQQVELNERSSLMWNNSYMLAQEAPNLALVELVMSGGSNLLLDSIHLQNTFGFALQFVKCRITDSTIVLNAIDSEMEVTNEQDLYFLTFDDNTTVSTTQISLTNSALSFTRSSDSLRVVGISGLILKSSIFFSQNVTVVGSGETMYWWDIYSKSTACSQSIVNIIGMTLSHNSQPHDTNLDTFGVWHWIGEVVDCNCSLVRLSVPSLHIVCEGNVAYFGGLQIFNGDLVLQDNQVFFTCAEDDFPALAFVVVASGGSDSVFVSIRSSNNTIHIEGDEVGAFLVENGELFFNSVSDTFILFSISTFTTSSMAVFLKGDDLSLSLFLFKSVIRIANAQRDAVFFEVPTMIGGCIYMTQSATVMDAPEGCLSVFGYADLNYLFFSMLDCEFNATAAEEATFFLNPSAIEGMQLLFTNSVVRITSSSSSAALLRCDSGTVKENKKIFSFDKSMVVVLAKTQAVVLEITDPQNVTVTARSSTFSVTSNTEDVVLCLFSSTTTSCEWNLFDFSNCTFTLDTIQLVGLLKAETMTNNQISCCDCVMTLRGKQITMISLESMGSMLLNFSFIELRFINDLLKFRFLYADCIADTEFALTDSKISGSLNEFQLICNPQKSENVFVTFIRNVIFLQTDNSVLLNWNHSDDVRIQSQFNNVSISSEGSLHFIVSQVGSKISWASLLDDITFVGKTSSFFVVQTGFPSFELAFTALKSNFTAVSSEDAIFFNFTLLARAMATFESKVFVFTECNVSLDSPNEKVFLISISVLAILYNLEGEFTDSVLSLSGKKNVSMFDCRLAQKHISSNFTVCGSKLKLSSENPSLMSATSTSFEQLTLIVKSVVATVSTLGREASLLRFVFTSCYDCSLSLSLIFATFPGKSPSQSAFLFLSGSVLHNSSVFLSSADFRFSLSSQGAIFEFDESATIFDAHFVIEHSLFQMLESEEGVIMKMPTTSIVESVFVLKRNTVLLFPLPSDFEFALGIVPFQGSANVVFLDCNSINGKRNQNFGSLIPTIIGGPCDITNTKSASLSNSNSVSKFSQALTTSEFVSMMLSPSAETSRSCTQTIAPSLTWTVVSTRSVTLLVSITATHSLQLVPSVTNTLYSSASSSLSATVVLSESMTTTETYTLSATETTSITMSLSQSVSSTFTCAAPEVMMFEPNTTTIFAAMRWGLNITVLFGAALRRQVEKNFIGTSWGSIGNISISGNALALKILPSDRVSLRESQTVTIALSRQAFQCHSDEQNNVEFQVYLSSLGLPSSKIARNVAAIGSLVGGSLSGALTPGLSFNEARGSMMMEISVCEFSHSEELPFSLNPLGWSFGPSQGMYYRGAAVANLVLLVGISLLIYLGALIKYIFWKKPEVNLDNTFRDLHLPGFLVLPYVLLCQSVVSVAVSLAAHGAWGFVDGFISFVSLAFCIVPVFFYCYWIIFNFAAVASKIQRRFSSAADMRRSARALSFFNYLYFGHVKWSDSGENPGFKKKYGCLFVMYRPGYHWALGVEVLLALTAGLLEGLRPDDPSTCQLMANLSLIDALIVALFSLVARPYASPFFQLYFLATSAVSVTACVALVLGFEALSDYLSMFLIFAALVTAVLEVALLATAAPAAVLRSQLKEKIRTLSKRLVDFASECPSRLNIVMRDKIAACAKELREAVSEAEAAFITVPHHDVSHLGPLGLEMLVQPLLSNDSEATEDFVMVLNTIRDHCHSELNREHRFGSRVDQRVAIAFSEEEAANRTCRTALREEEMTAFHSLADSWPQRAQHSNALFADHPHRCLEAGSVSDYDTLAVPFDPHSFAQNFSFQPSGSTLSSTRRKWPQIPRFDKLIEKSRAKAQEEQKELLASLVTELRGFVTKRQKETNDDDEMDLV